MANRDPVTGATLPADAIQRVLFVAPRVHIYQIPPITSTKGFQAASWTENNNQRLIFTARLRVLETAIPIAKPKPGGPEEQLSAAVLLEDPSSGELFAAAPYANPAVVQQASDSSRFFAIRVVGEGGRKATLGMGFEGRSDAFDFGVAMQDARRVLGMEEAGESSLRGAGVAARGRGGGAGQANAQTAEAEKRDYSLKEGETIKVAIGGKGQRGAGAGAETRVGEGDASAALFSIKPPPSGGGSGGGGAMPFLPPPPSASDVKAQQRGRRAGGTSPGSQQQQQSSDSGFGDDDFGEFTG